MLVVGLAVVVPWGLYRLRPERRLDLQVVDKTGPFRHWLEHRSLFWLVDHL